MKPNIHERTEALAGAIALGEASDEERAEYRAHIAACQSCLEEFGGEREIERVAVTVQSAREDEIWSPDLRDVVGAHTRRRNRRLQLGLGVGGLCLAVSLGVHALGIVSAENLSTAAGSPVVINAGPTRIVLEKRDDATPKPAAPAPEQRRMIVQHNVVQIARQPMESIPAPTEPPVKSPPPPAIAAVTVHADPTAAPQSHPHHSDIPIWRRNTGDSWRTVAMTTTTSLSETAPQTLTHSAESMQVASPHTMRDAEPVGGETAINPKPPMIAYDEGAEGTSAFEVLVDEHGNPTRCVITKSAGYTVLDASVCKAAMQTKFQPKLIDGRPVRGVYHDAFTFRMSEDDRSVEGVPKQIP